MSTAISKRRKAFANKVDRAKAYPALDAMKLVKETATAKFDESVDVAVNLGIDAKKSDQTVRGSVVLPAGTGKNVRVAVIDSAVDAGHPDLAGRVETRQDFVPARPGTASGVPGLQLAGDWIDTGLPATIEGAVRSGHMAASACVRSRS